MSEIILAVILVACGMSCYYLGSRDGYEQGYREGSRDIVEYLESVMEAKERLNKSMVPNELPPEA